MSAIGQEVTTRLHVALDAAIPDALLGALKDQSHTLSSITTTICKRIIEALDHEELLSFVVEAELLDKPTSGDSHLWARARLGDAGAPTILADVVRAMVYRGLLGAAERHLAQRAEGARMSVGYSEIAASTIVASNGNLGRYPRLVDGATFTEGVASEPEPWWGDAGRVLAARGEPLEIVGPQGVGKTTIAEQLALARLGLRDSALGLPVLADERRVLYLAMDRPRQAARSLARMIDSDDRRVLREKLLVHQGPPPFSVVKEPEALAEMTLAAGAGMLVLDSLKDLAPGLSKDEVGAAVNIALQHVIAAGSELTGLHHQRKATADNRKPQTLDDVYGSTWITSGAGSVVLLWGNPGDAYLELRHLKQPGEEFGPATVYHDHASGTSSIVDAISAEEVLASSLAGTTAHAAAGMLYATGEPTRQQIERARRQLERLVDAGKAERLKGTSSTDVVRYCSREAA